MDDTSEISAHISGLKEVARPDTACVLFGHIAGLKEETSGIRGQLEKENNDTSELLADIACIGEVAVGLRGAIEAKRAQAICLQKQAETAESLAATQGRQADEAESKVAQLIAQMEAKEAEANALTSFAAAAKREANSQRLRAEMAELAAEECRKWAEAAEVKQQAKKELLARSQEVFFAMSPEARYRL